jgi:hypothetical protein
MPIVPTTSALTSEHEPDDLPQELKRDQYRAERHHHLHRIDGEAQEGGGDLADGH